MLTLRQKLVVRLIVCAPVLAMLVYSALHVAGEMRRVLRDVEAVVVYELSRQLDREVKVGEVVVSPLGTAILRDVQIAEGKSFKQGRLLAARQVRVSYDFGEMRRGNAARSVKVVEFVEPRARLVRLADGSLNISDLLARPPGPPKPPFQGKLKLKNGTITFEDHAVSGGRTPVVVHLRQVTGSIDAAGHPDYSLHLSARANAAALRSIRATGVYESRTKSLHLDLDGRGVSAPVLARYIGFGDSIRISRGAIDATAGLNVRLAKRPIAFEVNGVGRVSDGTVLLPGFTAPASGVDGTLILVGDRAVLDLTGTLAGSRARVIGSISHFSRPEMNLAVVSPGVRLPDLLEALNVDGFPKDVRVTGVSDVTVKLVGPASDLGIDMKGTIGAVSASGYSARDIHASALYRQGIVTVRAARFLFMGARADASGTIDLRGGGPVSLRGRVRGLTLASLPLPPDPRVTGTASADFAVSGAIGKPEILLDANVSGGSVAEVPFSSASAQVRIAGGTAHVLALKAVGVAGGTLTASGSASERKLALDVAATGIQFGQLSRLVDGVDCRGVGYARGKVSGTTGAPAFDGMLEVFKGQYNGYHADYLRVRLAGDVDRVAISEGILRRFPAEMKFVGAVGGFGTDRLIFRLAAKGQRIRLEDAIALTERKLDLGGTVALDIEASGAYLLDGEPGRFPLEGAVAFGNVRLEDGTAFGHPIDTASADITLEDSVLHVTDATVTSEAAKLTIAGSVSADTKLVDMDFGLSGLDLARIRDRTGDYVLLAGVMNALGTVRGPWDDVALSVSSDVDKLAVNNTRFDHAQFEGIYSDNMVTSSHLKLTRGEQVYEVSGIGYDPETNCLQSGTARVVNGNVPEVWDMLRASPYLATDSAAELRDALRSIPRLTSGAVNATAEISGCLTRPDGILTLTAANIGIDIRQIDRLTVKASADDGVVTLTEFTAHSGEMLVNATGYPLYDEGSTNLSVSANNVDLSRLRPWLGDSTPSGMMTVELLAQGKARAPHVTGSIEIEDPGVGNLKFDRLRATRIEMVGDRIDFSDIILASGNHQVIVQGHLPWDWREFAIPSDRPVEVAARLNNEDLSILSTFAKEIDPDRTSGPLVAALDIGGTISDLKLDGKVRLSDGRLGIKGFTNDFTGIDIDLAIDGKQVLFSKCSADSSMGGSISIRPGSSIVIGDGDSRVDMLVVSDGLVIAEQNVLGYQERVKMQIDAGLTVAGTLLEPLIANAKAPGVTSGVVVSNSRISFAVPEGLRKPEMSALAVNPRFDVGLQLGRDVLIEPPSMQVVVGGGGSLTGSFTDPARPLVLEMDLQAKEGNLKLAATRLRVVPGGRAYVRYAPPTDPEEIRDYQPDLLLQDFRATASVMATDALGRRERYQVTLTAGGPVNNLQIGLSSSPTGLSRQQMLAALGHVEGIFTTGEGELQQELANVLTAVGTSTLFAPIEEFFVEKFGFEQFSLEYSPIRPLSLYAARRLFGNTYVSFYQRLQPGVAASRDSAYQLQLNYRFKNIYQFGFATDDQQVTSFEIGLTRPF